MWSKFVMPDEANIPLWFCDLLHFFASYKIYGIYGIALCPRMQIFLNIINFSFCLQSGENFTRNRK